MHGATLTEKDLFHSTSDRIAALRSSRSPLKSALVRCLSPSRGVSRLIETNRRDETRRGSEVKCAVSREIVLDYHELRERGRRSTSHRDRERTCRSHGAESREVFAGQMRSKAMWCLNTSLKLNHHAPSQISPAIAVCERRVLAEVPEV